MENFKQVILDGEVFNYWVGDKGTVKNLNGVRGQSDNGSGYKYLHLYVTKQRQKRMYVHRLVALMFIPNPEGKSQVNHINGDKSDNRVENLEWVTPSENIQHGHRKGLHGGNRSYTERGDDIIKASYEDVVYKGLGVREAADKYGLPRTTVSSYVNKHSKKAITDQVDKQYERS